MNDLTHWYKKLKDFASHGRVGAIIKGFLFINFSIFLGIWLGMQFFLPDDFILSKINERLFIKDMGLIAEDVDVSIFGNVSIYEGYLTEKGEKTASFYKLQFSPSFFDLMFGEISGTVFLEDINNQGGDIELSFETGENPCYSIELDKAPLSVFQLLMKDVSLVGDITGEVDICQNEKKTYSGSVELFGKDVVFRGTVPTNMGPLNIGKIALGSIDLVSQIENSVLSIDKFLTEGLFSVDIAGKITLNAKNFDAARLNLDVRIKAPDAKELEKNPTLNLVVGQMSKFKNGKDNYAFLLKGRAGQPRMLNAPGKRVIKTGKAGTVNKTVKDKNDRKKNIKKDRKRPIRKPVKRKIESKPKKDRTPPKRRESLPDKTSTRKLEDDTSEEKKEEKEVEKKEEVEKEADEEEAKEDVEVEKEKKVELPDTEKKEDKGTEENNDDEEE